MSEQLTTQAESSPDILGDILGKIIGSQSLSALEATPHDSAPSGTGGLAAENPQNPFGDALSSLLSNPELLLKLPSIISAAKPIIDMFSQAQKKASSPTPESVTVSIAPSSAEGQSAPTSTHGRDAECRNALLCAMKPYLSSERQHTIDYIVKLSRLGDILKTL